MGFPFLRKFKGHKIDRRTHCVQCVLSYYYDEKVFFLLYIKLICIITIVSKQDK